MQLDTTNSYFSADGHVVEPADLWVTRMDKRFRDRAPRIESGPDNDYYIVDGLGPMLAGFEGAMIDDKARQGYVDRPIHRHADTKV